MGDLPKMPCIVGKLNPGTRVLPLMDEFLCRKEEAAGHSRIKLATIWLGELLSKLN